MRIYIYLSLSTIIPQFLAWCCALLVISYHIERWTSSRPWLQPINWILDTFNIYILLKLTDHHIYLSDYHVCPVLLFPSTNHESVNQLHLEAPTPCSFSSFFLIFSQFFCAMRVSVELLITPLGFFWSLVRRQRRKNYVRIFYLSL